MTGTARGIELRANHRCRNIAASVNLQGLHMASDDDFNRKSFTTGHTGFGMPFAINPDRSDVPRSAARPLKYIDEYYSVNQGSVFFITEALATLEGLERGPAGNTSLAVAFKLAQTMEKDKVIVVQETEYTGAGKHHQPQLSFAKQNGVDIVFGDPQTEIPGKNIVVPNSADDIHIEKISLDKLRKSYLKRYASQSLTEYDYTYLKEEFRMDNVKRIEELFEEVKNERAKR